MRKPAQDIESFVLQGGAFFLLVALVGAVIPLRWVPPCLFHRLTGYPCFTCGATRSLKALVSGDFFDAWRLQPLLMGVGVGWGILLIVCGLRRALGCSGWEWAGFPPRWRWGVLAVGLATVIVNWIYLIRSGQ